MIYVWLDRNTGTRIEVERRLKEKDVPPYIRECLAAGIPENKIPQAKWERQLSRLTHVGKKGKGRW